MPKPKLELLKQSNDAEWRGMLAGLLFVGAGLWLAGSRKKAVTVWAAFTFVPPLLMAALYWKEVSPALSWLAPAVAVFLWLANLQLSWRPIPPQPRRVWAVLLGAAVLLGLACRFGSEQLMHAFIMPRDSMAPVLQPQDQFLVHKFAYWFTPPKRGDIIVFNRSSPSEGTQTDVQRIAALPGDTISWDADGLRVNNEVIGKPVTVVSAKYLARQGDSFKVPGDSVFVLGDNATRSYDSRFYGAIPISNIIGRASVLVHPANRITRLD